MSASRALRAAARRPDGAAQNPGLFFSLAFTASQPGYELFCTNVVGFDLALSAFPHGGIFDPTLDEEIRFLSNQVEVSIRMQEG